MGQGRKAGRSEMGALGKLRRAKTCATLTPGGAWPLSVGRGRSDMTDEHPDSTTQQPSPAGTERRKADRRDAMDRRSGLDRRRGPGRRRTDVRRSAEEGEMTENQLEFVLAVEEYKKVNRRPFPSWTELLDIMRSLGYRKVADRADIE